MLMLLPVFTLSAQIRSCDLAISGGIVGTTIVIDPSGLTPTYFDLYFENKGPDTIRLTDTVFLISPFLAGGAVLTLRALELPPATVINTKDTFFFKSGPPAGIYQYCDTIWMISSAADSAGDPDPSNNINCRDFDVVHKTTSVSGHFVQAEKTHAGTLSVFPNPAVSSVTFDFVARNNTDVIAGIYDLLGRKVMHTSFGKAYKGQQGYMMDVSSLEPGLYLVMLTQEAVQYCGKLLKQ